MVTQRTEGLYRLFLLCQVVIVAVLFWFGVWVMVTFYSPGAGAEFTWRRYFSPTTMSRRFWHGASSLADGVKKLCWLVRPVKRPNCETGSVVRPRSGCVPPV